MSKKDNQPKDIKIDIDLKKISLIAVGAGFVLSSFIVSGYAIYREIKTISSSWNEIQFAKKHPEIVNAVMADYENRVNEIKFTYTVKEEQESESKM